MRRRDVLLAAALAPGLAAGRNVNAQTASRARPLGVAMVGIGNYARFVMQRTRGIAEIELAGLVTGDTAKGGEIAKQYALAESAIWAYDDFDRLADDDRIDAVHICLPVGLHAEYTERALRAGKHVLCEKPIASSSPAARRLGELARAQGRVLMPAHRAWFSAHVQEVRRRVREALHGPLVAIDAHKGFRMQLPADNWRFDPTLAGAGCIFDIGAYSVQLCRWLGGGLPARVAATAVPGTRTASIEEHVAFTLEFRNGVMATGSASWRHRLQNRLCVATADSWMSLDPATPAIGERLTIGLDGPGRIEEVLLPPQDQLPVMYRHFAEAIRGASPELTVEDGVEDLRLMEAILLAARERRWIEIE